MLIGHMNYPYYIHPGKGCAQSQLLTRKLLAELTNSLDTKPLTAGSAVATAQCWLCTFSSAHCRQCDS